MVGRSWRAAAFLEGMLQTVLIYPVKVCPIWYECWMDQSVSKHVWFPLFSVYCPSQTWWIMFQIWMDMNGVFHGKFLDWTQVEMLLILSLLTSSLQILYDFMFSILHPLGKSRNLLVVCYESWRMSTENFSESNAIMQHCARDSRMNGCVLELWKTVELRTLFIISLLYYDLDGYNLVAKDFQALWWIHPGWKVIGHLLLCYGLLPEPPSF